MTKKIKTESTKNKGPKYLFANNTNIWSTVSLILNFGPFGVLWLGF